MDSWFWLGSGVIDLGGLGITEKLIHGEYRS
jgi:hypothetical protein